MNKHIDITGVVLTTPRLTLRPWKESDLHDFYEYARVDGVGQMAGWAPHKNQEESRMILASFITHKKTFALERQGKVIGSLGIETYKENDFPELQPLLGRSIGYVLSKDYWGQGLMTEAVQTVIAYLFEREGLDFLHIGHFQRNIRSRRVIEKCGFQPVRESLYETRFGTLEPEIEYLLFKEDWRKIYAIEQTDTFDSQ